MKICPAHYDVDNHLDCVVGINCSNSTFGDPVTQACVLTADCSFVEVSQGECVVRCSAWGNPLNRYCEDVCPWNPPVYKYYKDASTNIVVLSILILLVTMIPEYVSRLVQLVRWVLQLQ